MKHLLNISFLLILIGLSLYSIYLYTYEGEVQSNKQIIAKVVFVEGKVSKRAFLSSVWEDVSEGDDVKEKDTLRTSKGAKAKIKFLQSDNEILLSENSRAEMNQGAVNINKGSVENTSKGGNPFSIGLAGDISVNFAKREGVSLDLKQADFGDSMMEHKFNSLSEIMNTAELEIFKSEYLNDLAQGSRLEVQEKYWTEIMKRLKEYRLDKQNVKISIDEKSGSLRAQVNEGSVGLEVLGQVDAIEIKEGEGLLLDQKTQETKRVQLLDSPKSIYPSANTILFNQTEIVFYWNPNDLAESYSLKLSEIESPDVNLIKETASSNSLLFKGLKYGKQYTWSVLAIDQYGFNGKKASALFEIKEDKTPPKLEIEDIKLEY